MSTKNNGKAITMANKRTTLPRISVGDIYEDCAHHPILCTEAWPDQVEGISLFDGTGPRGCSVYACHPRKMTAEEVSLRIKNRDRWSAAQKAFSEDWGSGRLVRDLQAEESAAASPKEGS